MAGNITASICMKNVGISYEYVNEYVKDEIF